jgi:hypothetical protein
MKQYRLFVAQRRLFPQQWRLTLEQRRLTLEQWRLFLFTASNIKYKEKVTICYIIRTSIAMYIHIFNEMKGSRS